MVEFARGYGGEKLGNWFQRSQTGNGHDCASGEIYKLLLLRQSKSDRARERLSHHSYM